MGVSCGREMRLEEEGCREVKQINVNRELGGKKKERENGKRTRAALCKVKKDVPDAVLDGL